MDGIVLTVPLLYPIQIHTGLHCFSAFSCMFTLSIKPSMPLMCIYVFSNTYRSCTCAHLQAYNI